MKMHLNDGESYIKGRSPEKAAQLLQAAKDAGLEGSIRTTSYGYIVPEQLADPADATTTTTGRPLRKSATSLDEAEAVVADRPKAEDTDVHTSEPAAQYDPADYTVDEVIAYLDKADDAEIARVKEAEKTGKKRTTILNYTAEGAK
jgi:hypothetical protein